MRIALAGFVHETNTFSPFPSRLQDFGDWNGGPIPVGDEVFARTPPRVSLHGFARAAREAGHTLVPLLHASAQPSGQLERGCYEGIVARLCDALRAAGPVDAVFLELHGAMAAEHVPDADAETVERVRAVVGAAVPVVATLDSHGNVGRRLVEAADALVAYRTYPHVDMVETGERAMALLAPMLAGAPRPARAFRSVPYLMPIHLQTTLAEPCRGLQAWLAELEARSASPLSLSLMTGFPLADVPDCGPSVFGYGTDAQGVNAAVDDLLAAVLAVEGHFRVDLPDADAAVQAALGTAADRPVVLADVQDNAGGGASSDTVWIIEALLRAGAPDAAVGLLCDPEAAAAAHAAGEGAVLPLRLGGKAMPGHRPLEATFVVERLFEGRFALRGPMLAGGDMDLGQMAQLRIGGVRIVVTSRRHWYVERECFRAVGVDPERHCIVVVKSTNHYRADFGPIAAHIVEFAAPGAVAMDPTQLDYRHVAPGLRLRGHGPTVRGHA
jgi:microcystin degradation protein MlrC